MRLLQSASLMELVSRDGTRSRSQEVVHLLEPEPTRGLEPRTYRLQDSSSTVTMAATSGFCVYSDCFGGFSGTGEREFVSRVVSHGHAS